MVILCVCVCVCVCVFIIVNFLHGVVHLNTILTINLYKYLRIFNAHYLPSYVLLLAETFTEMQSDYCVSLFYVACL